MAKKPKTSSCNSTVSKYPRAHATLDLWIGKDQFVASGVSTDPAILWNEPHRGAARMTGKEKSVPKSIPIV